VFVEHIDDGGVDQRQQKAEPWPRVALAGDLSDGIRPLLIEELGEHGIRAQARGAVPSGGRLLGAIVGLSVPSRAKRAEVRKQLKHLKSQLHELVPEMGPDARVLVVVSCADEPAAQRVDESLCLALRDIHSQAELEQAYELSLNAFDITGSTDLRLVTSRIVGYLERAEVPVTGEVATIQETRHQSLCAALAQRFVL